MQGHTCHKCHAVVLKRNRICTRCGAVVNSRPLPVFWFMFTAGLFVAYACLGYAHIV